MTWQINDWEKSSFRNSKEVMLFSIVEKSNN